MLSTLSSKNFECFLKISFAAIIVDDASKTIYVVDAKYLKPTFFYMSFPTDAEKFREENGYEFKLSNKIRWVADNILLLSRQLKRKDILEYNVEGFFITDRFEIFSIYDINRFRSIIYDDEINLSNRLFGQSLAIYNNWSLNA